jgi:hypothetical protein
MMRLYRVLRDGRRQKDERHQNLIFLQLNGSAFRLTISQCGKCRSRVPIVSRLTGMKETLI